MVPVDTVRAPDTPATSTAHHASVQLVHAREAGVTNCCKQRHGDKAPPCPRVGVGLGGGGAPQLHCHIAPPGPPFPQLCPCSPCLQVQAWLHCGFAAGRACYTGCSVGDGKGGGTAQASRFVGRGNSGGQGAVVVPNHRVQAREKCGARVQGLQWGAHGAGRGSEESNDREAGRGAGGFRGLGGIRKSGGSARPQAARAVAHQSGSQNRVDRRDAGCLCRTSGFSRGEGSGRWEAGQTGRCAPGSR